jgi:O-antigen/teichoic acid export membrane protein
VSLSGSEPAARVWPTSIGGMIAWVKAFLRERTDSRLAQLVAGKVFLVRIASALLALVAQVLLARWMGRFEFGVYIYAWTWVLMIGPLTDVGLSSAARRFIPEYVELKDFDRLRGFLSGSRWVALGVASAIALIGVVVVTLISPWLKPYAVIPLYLTCIALPICGVGQAQSGVAQSYDWPNLAFAPFYIIRQFAIVVLIAAAYLIGAPIDAVTVMIVGVAITWAVTVGQTLVLNRRLKNKVPDGPRRYEVKEWFATSLPIFMAEGFYLLLTYVDIIALEHLGSPEQVAVYYAAARLLAVVAFVYFSISSATTHKFTEYHVSGDKARLASFFAESIRWTFWPSLAVCAMILAFGRPLLALFGASFESGYPVMFILAAGLMARAAVGPAERLLNMLGQRKQCAMVYAAAFAINLGLCVILIPRIGIEGAATATSVAIIAESIMFYIVAKRRLGFHVFIMGGASPSH